jgi:hypothetical protein
VSYSVRWEHGFVATLRREVATWQEQARICGAVYRFAESGAGNVRRLRPNLFSLEVRPYSVRFSVEDGVIVAWALLRLDG